MDNFKEIKRYISKNYNSNEIKALLKNKPDINHLFDKDGNSLLHWAIISGNYPLAKALIKTNMNLDHKNSQGCTPFEFAIQYKEKKIIELLIKHHVKFFSREGFTTLHAVSAYGNLNLFNKIVKNYRNQNMKDLYGRSPLHWAAQEGNLTITKALIKNGAKVNLRDKEGFTALYYAVAEGYNSFFNLLIANGASYQMKYKSGSIMHVACAWNRLYIAKKLIRLGIKTNLINKDGDTPLHYAFKYNYPELIRLLIRNEPKKDAENMDRWKPFELETVNK